MTDRAAFVPASQSMRVMVSGGFPGLNDDVTQEVLKHQPGRHDQKSHTPKAYAGRGGPVGLQPDLERQERFLAILNDPELGPYHRNKAIRDELESLEGGPEALRQLEKWYYNPGDPEQALLDDQLYDWYAGNISPEKQLDYPFEDWVQDQAVEMGWDPEGDTVLLNTLRSIKDGKATSAQVKAMSAIYDYNQAYIKHAGVGEVSVHRGLSLEPYEVDVLKPGNKVGTALTGHWSEDKDVSTQFAAQVFTKGTEEWDFREVVIHKTFKPEEIFNYYGASADKSEGFAAEGLSREKEVVPVDGTEHMITKTETRPSDWTGLEVLHVWLE